MITAIVQYKLPPSISLADCAAHFRKIAPGFRDGAGARSASSSSMPRMAGPAASICGRRRGDAEAFYSGPWLDGIRERYGMDPQIKYFETACIADNAAEAVLLSQAAE